MNNARNIAFWVVLFLLILALFNLISGGQSTMATSTVSYSDFGDRVEDGDVTNATIDGEKIIFRGGDQRLAPPHSGRGHERRARHSRLAPGRVLDGLSKGADLKGGVMRTAQAPATVPQRVGRTAHVLYSVVFAGKPHVIAGRHDTAHERVLLAVLDGDSKR